MTPPNDAPSSPGPQAISDNYETYLLDEYGYAYGARDIVPLRTLERHDRLVEHPRATLEDLDRDELDDFERFGLARGFAEREEFEAFATCIDRLLASDDEHEGLQYHELPLYAAIVGLRQGEHDRAATWLEAAIDRWSDRARPARLLMARVALDREDEERAAEIHESLAEDHPEDPELTFEIAEDLAGAGAEARASEWVERTRERARDTGDRAVEVDLNVLASRLGDE